MAGPVLNGRRRLSLAFSLFPCLALTQADPWAAAVLVDELDTGGLKCLSKHYKRRLPRPRPFTFKKPHCRDA
jgi:hypothetical protein